MYDCYIRVRVENVGFFLKFTRVNPKIIASAVGKILATCLQNAVIIIVKQSLVWIICKKAYFIRVTCLIVTAHSKSAIGRTVFAYDYLKWKITLLRKDGVECAPYQFS